MLSFVIRNIFSVHVLVAYLTCAHLGSLIDGKPKSFFWMVDNPDFRLTGDC